MKTSKRRKMTAAQRHSPNNFQAMMSTPYNGASDKRSMSEWFTSFGDADSEILLSLQLLRDRSRDLLRNAPAATGAIEKLVTGVIGSGLRLQSSIDHEYLGLTEQQAQEWQEKAQYEFRIWSESKDCDYMRQLNFVGLQRLAFRSKLTSGDCFALLPYKTGGSIPYSLRVQLIEAERVVNDKDLPDTAEIAGGIERTKNGIPKSIFVRTPHPGATFFSAANTSPEWKRIPFYGEKTGRRNVLHLVDVGRIGQSRGVPILAPVIDLMKQVTKYSEAELSAAVVNAMLAVFIKRPATDPANGGSISYDYEKGKAPWERPDNFKLGSGTWVDGSPGEELQIVNAGRPSSQYDPFFTACMKQIGMALGIPFEVLINHFSSSYSASRAALLEFYDTVLRMRDDFADNFNQPIYDEFLAEAVMLGRLKAPGFFTDPMVRLAYTGAYWVGDSQKQIDEVKEANAALIRIKGCTSTLQIECSKRGLDYKDILRQRAEEKNFAKELGLEVEFASAFNTTSTPEGKEDNNGENNE
jgi:lambda family phage portal protein